MDLRAGVRYSFSLLLRVAVTILGLAYIAASIPISNTIEVLQSATIGLVLLAIIVVVIRFISTTLSLYFLVIDYESLSFWLVFDLDAAEFVANSFIPSSFGSIVAAPVLFDRLTPLSKRDGLSIKALQFGLYASVVGLTLPVAYWLITTQSTPPAIFSLLLLSSMAIFLGFASVVFLWILLPSVRKLEQYLPDQVVSGKLAPAAKATFSRNTAIAFCLLFTAHIILVGARFGLLSHSLGIQLDWWLYLFVPVLSYSVTVLPISISGIGITESVGTVMLAALGVPPAQAGALIILDRFLGSYLQTLVLYFYVTTFVYESRFEGLSSLLP